MEMMKLFVKKLTTAGIELNQSKYSEDCYVSHSFSCPNLSENKQVSVLLTANVSNHKIYVSLSHGISIILTPIDLPVKWDELTEEDVSRLANNYVELYFQLECRATFLMSPLPNL